jgi:nicotinate-nucleotide pyrophosphorylase (carboxylating)
MVDPGIEVEVATADGAEVERESIVWDARGRARSILTAERTALNFLGRLSGIATLTAAYVDAVAGTSARIVCTRKTTPGLRALEKYAVRCGGGWNHRFGLDDAVLIKDNHLAAAGGVCEAVQRVRRAVGHTVLVELEVDTKAQLEKGLAAGVDAVLLDNMSPGELAECVALVGGRITTEASGGVTLDTVREIAQTGVDLISVGALTHSATSLDLSLELSL